MIWWGEYDQGYFAMTLTVKISFLLLHHVNNARLRICPQPVVCFRNFLENKYHQIHTHKMSAHGLGQRKFYILILFKSKMKLKPLFLSLILQFLILKDCDLA